jgi:hypothetical protein
MNPQQDYYNFALRYLETTNQMLRQIDNVNRNLYLILNPSRNIGQSRPRRYTTPNTNHIWRNTFTPNNPPIHTTMDGWATQLLNNTFLDNTFLDNVIVYPTEQQIQIATSSVNLVDLAPGTINCPITMENFNSDSDIVRINHCGHVFSRNAIMRWFRNHVSCPVCRYDIRQESTNNSSDSYVRHNHNTGAEAGAEENASSSPVENNTNTNTNPNSNLMNGSNVHHQLYQFDFTLDSGSDIISNVINGLSNLNLSNDTANRNNNYNERRYES